MKKLKDLRDKRFGRLIAQERVSRAENIKNGTFWLCICDCGNKKAISSSSLIEGKTLSCGCLKKENSESRKIEYGMSAFNRLLRSYNKHAKQRCVSFELTNNQFKELIDDNCFYCGIEPSQVMKSGNKNGDYTYNGIDRKDSKKGYCIDNCVSCCKQCNRAKTNFTLESFYNWIIKVYERLNKK